LTLREANSYLELGDPQSALARIEVWGIADHYECTPGTKPKPAMSETDAGRDRVVAWIESRFDELAARVPAETVAALPRFGSGCSRARFDELAAFLAEEKRAVPGTERRIESVRDAVDDCVRLREAQGEAVGAYLREFSERSGI
jgi:hypothetical protein